MINKTLGDVIKEGKGILEKEGIESPDVDLEVFLSDLFNCSRPELYLNLNQYLNSGQTEQVDQFIERRKQSEPVAYIQNKKNFLGTDFYVDERVLIPRPETELLVEAVIDYCQQRELVHPRILDVGTGSGCIALSLAKKIPHARLVATDKSPDALKVAKLNAQKMGLGGKIRFYQGSLYQPLWRDFRPYFDIIVSNPPYVSSSEMDELQPDLKYEPISALVAGQDGLEVIKPLVHGSRAFLRYGGVLFFEIGFDQKEKATALLKKHQFKHIRCIQDLSELNRIMVGEWFGSI